jgi:hypothetical protein
MLDHCSAAQDSWTAGSPTQDSLTPGSANQTHSPNESLDAAGPVSPSTRTLERSGQTSFRQSSSSQAGFPAPTSLSLDSVPALAGQAADYGITSPVWFANYDPDSYSWRTSQASLFEEWAEFSETWPQAGMTRNGSAYRRRPSVPRIYERDSGLLPTPLATETGWRREPYSQGGKSLSTTIGGPANPQYVEWMMGVPIGWTDSACLATASSLLSRNGSDCG